MILAAGPVLDGNSPLVQRPHTVERGERHAHQSLRLREASLIHAVGQQEQRRLLPGIVQIPTEDAPAGRQLAGSTFGLQRGIAYPHVEAAAVKVAGRDGQLLSEGEVLSRLTVKMYRPELADGLLR